MPTLSIRTYDPEDAEAVWDLHERALREAGAFDPELTHLDADLTRIETEYLDAGGTFLVGEYDGSVVAMGAVRPLSAPPLSVPAPIDFGAHVPDPARAGVLKRIRVDPEYYRRGFGSRLLSALESWAEEAGLRTLVLDTRPTQEAAVAFYESHGYERVGRVSTDHGPVVFYRKAVGAEGHPSPD